jgi:hypothetical protein
MGRSDFAVQSVAGGSAHEVEVQPSGVALVRQTYARTFGFPNEPLFRGARVVTPAGQSRLRSYVLKSDRSSLDECSGSDWPVLAIETGVLWAPVRHAALRSLYMVPSRSGAALRGRAALTRRLSCRRPRCGRQDKNQKQKAPEVSFGSPEPEGNVHPAAEADLVIRRMRTDGPSALRISLRRASFQFDHQNAQPAMCVPVCLRVTRI